MSLRQKTAPLVAEALGTAILTFVVLAVARSAIGIPYFLGIGIGLTLALLVITIGSISGAHVNPAVTFGLWTLRKIKTSQALLYVAAQFIGALAALQLYTYLLDQKLQSTAASEFDWRILVAELVGTFVFGFGIAAALYQKYQGGKLALTIGGSLGVGVILAGVVSNAALNPAIALAIQSWSVAYVVGPLLGALLGMNLYALVFAGDKLVISQPIKKQSSSSPKKTGKSSK